MHNIVEFTKKHIFFVFFVVIMLLTFSSIDQWAKNVQKESIIKRHEMNSASQICQKDLLLEKYPSAVSCYSSLVEKYEKFEFRYGLALSLSGNKRYGEALEQLQYILKNEK